MKTPKFLSGPKVKKALKRFGIGGFLFFLLKGIAWLVLGYFVVR